MRVFAISDLHLSLAGGKLQRPMDRFGAVWADHHKQIEADWRERVSPADIVLVAGDISWASRLTDAQEDLLWLDRLPGEKILVEGNHDWWMPPSVNKARAVLPPSVRMVMRDALLVGDVILFGTRLWRIPGLDFPEDPRDETETYAHDAKTLGRELARLKLSIEAASLLSGQNPGAVKICMTHFPPADFSGRTNQVTEMLADLGTQTCIFGHVHGLPPGPNGVLIQGCRYYLTTPDYLQFRLLEIAL